MPTTEKRNRYTTHTFRARDYRGEMKTVEVTGRILFQDVRYRITLLQTKSAMRFVVVYGLQVRHCANYSEAAEHVGYSIMHALECDGAILRQIGRLS